MLPVPDSVATYTPCAKVTLSELVCRSTPERQERKARKAARRGRRAARQAAESNPDTEAAGAAAQEDVPTANAAAVAASGDRPGRATSSEAASAHSNQQPALLPALSAAEPEPDAPLVNATAAAAAKQPIEATVTPSASATSLAAAAAVTAIGALLDQPGHAATNGTAAPPTSQVDRASGSLDQDHQHPSAGAVKSVAAASAEQHECQSSCKASPSTKRHAQSLPAHQVSDLPDTIDHNRQPLATSDTRLATVFDALATVVQSPAEATADQDGHQSSVKASREVKQETQSLTQPKQSGQR